MAKKHWSVFLGLSLVAGVASSLFLKNKSKDALPNHLSLQNQYQGTWWFVDQHHRVQHSLEISSDFALKIDGKDVIHELLELTTSRLVGRDQYGYHLVIHCQENLPVTFYDEANDCTYLLEKKEGPQ